MIIKIGIIVAVIAVITYFAIPTLDEITQREEVQLSVQKTIDSFDGTLDSVILREGKYYSFVVDEKLEKILLHPRKELIDTVPTALTNANIPVEEMIERLDEYGSIWVDYEFYDPITGNVEPKTSYFVSHEGYVFGAGYYTP